MAILSVLAVALALTGPAAAGPINVQRAPTGTRVGGGFGFPTSGLLPTRTPGGFPGRGGDDDDGSIIPTGIFGGGDDAPIPTPGSGFPGFPGFGGGDESSGPRPTPTGTRGGSFWDFFPGFGGGDDDATRPTGAPEGPIATPTGGFNGFSHSPTGTKGKGKRPVHTPGAGNGFGNGNGSAPTPRPGNESGRHTPGPRPTGGFGGFPGGDTPIVPTGVPDGDTPIVPTDVPDDDTPIVPTPTAPTKPTATGGAGGELPTYTAAPGNGIEKRNVGRGFQA